jgi:asparagine synthase (glutamine-hydrolysing)
MCGIAGVVGGARPDPGLLERMATRMAHRGPDSQGIWYDTTAGLAVRRLAIIDLEERSNQPLHLDHWHLAFNGEIYNYRELREELRNLGHRFVTEGDGEVLLHAWAQWQEAALDRLNGMFAFAVWDDMRRELVCARDPFGEKPLYWASEGDRFAFASSVWALLKARPDIGAPRVEALGPFLGRSIMPSNDKSFFEGVQTVPAAHLLRVQNGRVKVEQYWAPERVEVPSRYEEAVEALRALLDDAVRLRLRSDVAVGTSLSGGVDSSAVVSIAATLGSERRHAFTASFPGFDRDERHYAEATARQADVLKHHIVEPTAAEWLRDAEDVVRYHEEPFGSTSIYAQWRVMQAARDAGVTVLLDGQGADELFGGYKGANGWALRAKGPAAVVRGLASSRDRGDVMLAIGSDRLPYRLARRHRSNQVGPYLSDAVRDAAAEVTRPAVTGDGLVNPLARELLRQSFETSLPALLRYADRSSMAFSREVRLPFLDRRLAEYALSLPARFIYRDGVKKAVLRDAVRRNVPSEVLARRDKVGFETPQAQWLEHPGWRSRIRELLLSAEGKSRGLYRTAEIEADFRREKWRDPDAIWRALIVEIWLNSLSLRTNAA